MAESLSLIDNNNITIAQKPLNHENPCGESTESVSPAYKSSFRTIEFHLARKPFTGFSNDGGFMVESLNNNNQHSVGSESVGGGLSGKKRDASELDQELSFQITIRRIGAGLENLGNTCFLNSVLQCLTYTEPLAAYLQSGKHQVTCRKSGFCALCAIQNHVSRALELPGRSLAPKDLVSNLRCISRTFRNSRQEDAHEYMVNLLESMHRCCLPKGVPIESQSAYDKSLVHKIFGGQLRSQVKCMQCNYCSNKFDPFLDISLEILDADTLYKAFANFTAKEHLDGGAKEYQCQQCKQKVKALKQLTIYKAPNVLTVHLKRFGCHMSGQKIDKKVHFGPTLDLKPFVTGPYDGDLKYTLYGVLVHAGWSTRSGHYYCFVRTSSGMWYALDDNQVFQVSEKTVFEQKAYMLFYFKDRNNFSSKKAKDVHQKEKSVMNGVPNGPREAQMKAGPSNCLLNAQTLLKKPADVAQQKENIVMTDVPNGPGVVREAQMKTGPSDCLLNAQTSSKETADVTQQKEDVAINGALNGPGVPTEAQMNTGLSNGLSSVTPKEAQMKTCNVSVNDQKSLPAVGVEGNGLGPVALKAQMKTGLSDGSLNDQQSLAAVDAEGNGPDPDAPKETQTDSKLSTDASEPEQAQTKETSVTKSISEPSKTEAYTKEIDEGESALPKIDHGGKTRDMETSNLPQKESFIKKKAFVQKPRKKANSLLKCKLTSMKFSSIVLLGASLNRRKKKKHKRNKWVKNLAQENLVKVKEQETVKVKLIVDDEFKPRIVEDGAVLATSDNNSGSRLNDKESNQSSQKDFLCMLIRGIEERPVPRWDDDESAPSQIFSEERQDLAIGYTGDKWDEEYDRGKRKKVKISKTEFDKRNPFQDIANERLKSHSQKQNSSKNKNKQFNQSRSSNVPYRI